MTDSIAQKDFEQFCFANDVKPTNMKADFYIAGHIKGQQRMIEKACEIYRKELSDVIEIFNRLGKELYNINELGELISLEGSVKDFKKAMEE